MHSNDAVSWLKKLATVLVFAAGTPLAAVPAAAQSQGSDTVPTELQEVVVTAEKRPQSLQSVAASISAVGQAQIQALDAKTLTDVARAIPGLQLVNNGISDVPAIRGIYSTVGAATVGYYIDDTPVQAEPGFMGNPDLDLFDLSRIEVLRGPQGTLYGGSAMGGTIRFITPQPSLSGSSGRVHAELAATQDGNPDYDVGAAYGMPLIDNVLGFRGSVYYDEEGGYIDRISRTTGDVVQSNVNNAGTLQLATSFLWQVTPGLSIKPSILYQSERNDDMPMFLAGLPPLEQNYTTSQPGHDTFDLPSLTIDYDFGGLKLISVTSYFHRTQRQIFDYSTLVPELLTGQPIVPGFTNYPSRADQGNSQENVSQEFRLTSPQADRLHWIFGLFFANEKQDLDFPLYEPEFSSLVESLYGAPPSAVFGFAPLANSVDFYTNTQTVERQLAAYGEATYRLIGKLNLTAGLRVSRSELGYNRVANGPLNGGPGIVNGEQRAYPVTPKFALSYALSEEGLLYASAAKGFRVGGVNNSVPLAQCAADLKVATGGLAPKPTYQPDSLWDYEGGIKFRTPSRRLQVNASAFLINWSNMQQSVDLPDCGFGYVANFGSARSRGFELETALLPLSGLELTMALDYTDARLSSNVFGPASPSTGQQAVFGRDGDRVPGVPLWTASASAQYNFSVSAEATAYVRGDYQYVGDSMRTTPTGEVGYDPAIYRAAAYGYGSMRLGTLWKNWDFALFIDNIANSRPIIGAYTQLEPATDTPRETTLRPRTIGISFDRKFD
jgi:outer membrane receptor protein involved in Fe transport